MTGDWSSLKGRVPSSRTAVSRTCHPTPAYLRSSANANTNANTNTNTNANANTDERVTPAQRYTLRHLALVRQQQADAIQKTLFRIFS